MKFTEETSRKYLGGIRSAYLAYAADDEVRSDAASGGAVTALLGYLLDREEITGAIVTKAVCSGGRIDCAVVLAKTRDEILSARTSKYIDASVVSGTLRLLKEHDGPAAVVGLPCHTSALRAIARRDARLGDKIRYIITLFCNHTSDRYLLDKVLAKEGIDQARVREFAFRKGHWRGTMTGVLDDGSEFSFPFGRFSRYHNLNFFCLTRCLHCHDHTGYESDFSAGDAWLGEMKKEPIKHSIILSRNDRATAILDEMMRSGALVGRRIDEATIWRSQKRSLIYHYNVSARARAGRRHGLVIKDAVNAKVRWNDLLAAHVILMNYRWSRSETKRDWIFAAPRPVVTAYFLFLKFLQNF